MAESDEEKTAFHTSHGVYCYTKMPFGLKNAGATYKRLMDKAFDSQVGRNIKVYVDDLVIKSHTETEMLRDIDETFQVQSLNGKLASLKRFLSKSVKKSLSLFKTLKKCIKKSDFHWPPEAEQAFKQLKQYLSELPMLVAPKPKEELIVYMVISEMERHDGRTRYHVLADDICERTDPADFIIENPDEAPPDTSVLETPQEPFQFTASNNEAEYEALIAGLRIIAQIGVRNVHVLVEVLKEKSIQENEVATVVEEDGPTWMTPIMEYLKDGTLPDDRKKASKLRIKARQYELLEGVLYKRMHAGPWSVVAKAMRLGYYWPTMHRDAHNMIRKCNDCQIHRPAKKPPTAVDSRHGSMAILQACIEAKAMATITGSQVNKFVWDNIVCRFGLPGEIVSDNVKHPQSNRLVEREIRSVGEGIKARLGKGNKNWIEELPYNPTYRTAVVDVVHNDEELRLNLDLLEERRECATIREAKDKLKMTKGKLGPKWEGPYEVTEALKDGAYMLRSMEGKILPRTWNIVNLKKCYL
nr:hypothetical protein [Tanacetum cinerariifolium]